METQAQIFENIEVAVLKTKDKEEKEKKLREKKKDNRSKIIFKIKAFQKSNLKNSSIIFPA